MQFVPFWNIPGGQAENEKLNDCKYIDYDWVYLVTEYTVTIPMTMTK